MRTPWISVVLFVVAAFLGAAGQFLYKSGTDRAVASGGQFLQFVVNARILGGVLCYVLVMVCFVAAFRQGGTPSVLYPIYATTFIWSAVIGQAAYQVPIKALHVVGMVLIVLGMSLMGR